MNICQQCPKSCPNPLHLQILLLSSSSTRFRLLAAPYLLKGPTQLQSSREYENPSTDGVLYEQTKLRSMKYNYQNGNAFLVDTDTPQIPPVSVESLPPLLPPHALISSIKIDPLLYLLTYRSPNRTLSLVDVTIQIKENKATNSNSTSATATNSTTTTLPASFNVIRGAELSQHEFDKQIMELIKMGCAEVEVSGTIDGLAGLRLEVGGLRNARLSFQCSLSSSSPVYHPVTYMGLVAIEQRLAATEVRPCSNLVSSSQDLPSVAMTKIGGAPVALDRSVHDLHNSTQLAWWIAGELSRQQTSNGNGSPPTITKIHKSIEDQADKFWDQYVEETQQWDVQQRQHWVDEAWKNCGLPDWQPGVIAVTAASVQLRGLYSFSSSVSVPVASIIQDVWTLSKGFNPYRLHDVRHLFDLRYDADADRQGEGHYAFYRSQFQQQHITTLYDAQQENWKNWLKQATNQQLECPSSTLICYLPRTILGTADINSVQLTLQSDYFMFGTLAWSVETKDKQAQVAPTSLQLVRGLQLTEVTAILTLGMREPPNDTNCKVPLVMLTGKVAIHLQTNVQKKEEGKKEEEKKEEEKKDAADEMGSCAQVVNASADVEIREFHTTFSSVARTKQDQITVQLTTSCALHTLRFHDLFTLLYRENKTVPSTVSPAASPNEYPNQIVALPYLSENILPQQLPHIVEFQSDVEQALDQSQQVVTVTYGLSDQTVVDWHWGAVNNFMQLHYHDPSMASPISISLAAEDRDLRCGNEDKSEFIYRVSHVLNQKPQDGYHHQRLPTVFLSLADFLRLCNLQAIVPQLPAPIRDRVQLSSSAAVELAFDKKTGEFVSLHAEDCRCGPVDSDRVTIWRQPSQGNLSALANKMDVVVRVNDRQSLLSATIPALHSYIAQQAISLDPCISYLFTDIDERSLTDPESKAAIVKAIGVAPPQYRNTSIVLDAYLHLNAYIQSQPHLTPEQQIIPIASLPVFSRSNSSSPSSSSSAAAAAAAAAAANLDMTVVADVSTASSSSASSSSSVAAVAVSRSSTSFCLFSSLFVLKDLCHSVLHFLDLNSIIYGLSPAIRHQPIIHAVALDQSSFWQRSLVRRYGEWSDVKLWSEEQLEEWRTKKYEPNKKDRLESSDKKRMWKSQVMHKNVWLTACVDLQSRLNRWLTYTQHVLPHPAAAFYGAKLQPFASLALLSSAQVQYDVPSVWKRHLFASPPFHYKADCRDQYRRLTKSSEPRNGHNLSIDVASLMYMWKWFDHDPGCNGDPRDYCLYHGPMYVYANEHNQHLGIPITVEQQKAAIQSGVVSKELDVGRELRLLYVPDTDALPLAMHTRSIKGDGGFLFVSASLEHFMEEMEWLDKINQTVLQYRKSFGGEEGGKLTAKEKQDEKLKGKSQPANLIFEPCDSWMNSITGQLELYSIMSKLFKL